MNALEFEAIYNYLSSNVYPDDVDKIKKRNLRRRASAFVVREGQLYYSAKDGEKLVVQAVDKERILVACHSDFGGGHFGRDKTTQKIEERYYWRGIQSDVRRHVEACDKCQRVNSKFVRDEPVLHPVPVPNGAWRQVGMDLIGPLPTTSSGNRYIFELTDYFSKWPEAIPIQSKTAGHVMEALYSVICRHGAMECLITDQGREFVNELKNDLIKIFTSILRDKNTFAT